MSELANDRIKKYDNVFGMFCTGVNERLKRSINRGRLSFIGCTYTQKAQTEILAEGLMCTAQVAITPEELKAVMPGLSLALVQKYTPILNDAMQEFGIDTPFRRNMFLAQVAHESNELRWLLERPPKGIPPQEYFKRYDNRKDLGNIEPGDGLRYRGRGVIQITGRQNYKQVGEGLNLDLVDKPWLLEDPVNAIRASAFWWKKNGLNIHADKYPYDILGASVRVNGINAKNRLPNHLQERKKRFVRISKILGI
jgi:putative chitinase